MNIKGKAAEYLVRTDPRLYGKYVILENRVTVLYVSLQSPIWAIKGFLTLLQEICERFNRAWLIANIIVKWKQHTLCWHMDDVESSHPEKDVQDVFEDWLIDTYDHDCTGRSSCGEAQRMHWKET